MFVVKMNNHCLLASYIGNAKGYLSLMIECIKRRIYVSIHLLQIFTQTAVESPDSTSFTAWLLLRMDIRYPVLVKVLQKC